MLLEGTGKWHQYDEFAMNSFYFISNKSIWSLFFRQLRCIGHNCCVQYIPMCLWNDLKLDISSSFVVCLISKEISLEKLRIEFPAYKYLSSWNEILCRLISSFFSEQYEICYRLRFHAFDLKSLLCVFVNFLKNKYYKNLKVIWQHIIFNISKIKQIEPWKFPRPLSTNQLTNQPTLDIFSFLSKGILFSK